MTMDIQGAIVVNRNRRVYSKKVRTGCSTCKLRRVKCDEGKPACSRCIKCGIDCDGYLPSKASLRDPVSNKSRLPKLQPKLQPLCQTPATRLFNDNQQYGFFQRFRGTSAILLTGIQASDFWTRVVLQASEMEPNIRHAATAIGALTFNRSQSDGELVGKQQEFAYREYHKAVVGLRKSIVTNSCDLRTKLIFCILFACFESYHGNNGIAVSQIFAAADMMDQGLQETKDGKRSISNIDEDLVASLQILEIQASAWEDKRDSKLHLRRMRVCDEAIKSMPATFTTLKEATIMLDTNMLRGIHLRHSLTNETCQKENLVVPPFLGLNSCYSGPEISQLGDIVSKFQDWYAAFEPLYRKAKSSQAAHFLERATLIRMHYYGSLLWCVSGSPMMELYYRRYTKELKEMVATAKYVLNQVTVVAASSFSMDICIVVPLAVVGLNYRHRASRQEAISILSTMVKKEAIWDAAMVWTVMKWLAEIEEVGLNDEEYVPEDVVATIVKMQVDETQKSVLVGCTQGIKGRLGETDYKEAMLYW